MHASTLFHTYTMRVLIRPTFCHQRMCFYPSTDPMVCSKKSPPHSDVLNKKEMDRTTEAGACFQPIHQSSRTWKGHVDVICSTASQLLQSRADVKAGCGFESSRLLRASLGSVPKTSKDGDFTAPSWTPFHYRL